MRRFPDPKTAAARVAAATLLIAPIAAVAHQDNGTVTPPPAAANPPVDTAPGTPPAVAPAPAPIAVTVNGEAIVFTGQQPVQQEGFVMVPLRGVFEKLGATVQYAAATKTVNAVKGNTSVMLRLGDPYAYLNGAPRPLAVVPQAVNGTTLVPLRFISEALGAKVSWKKDTRTVEITTGPPLADQLPTPIGNGPVLGTITALMLENNALTLRVPGGENDQLPLAPNVTLMVKSSDEGPETAAPVNTLKINDQITATRDDQGRATVLRLRTDQRRGAVKSIGEADATGDAPVTLTDGTVVTMAAGAPAAMSGRVIQLSDILPDETVVIRIDPKTGKGTGVAVATEDDANPTPPVKLEVTAVALGPGMDHALRAGEKLTVTLAGTPGTTATFTVPGLPEAQNVAMTEATPGNYTGTLDVPKGITLKEATVTGTVAQGENTTAPVSAPTTLTIDSAAPDVESLTPTDGSALAEFRPLIYGTFADPGSGVDTQSVRLTIDGNDVTAGAKISDSFFSYKPAADLPVGDHTVALVVKDAAGNDASRSWKFKITGAANPIRSLSLTPDDGVPLAVGSTLRVRMDAPAGGTATFRIGNAIVNQPMTDVGGGSYIGNYTVKSGDVVNKATVTVTYTPPGNGAPILQAAPAPVTLMGGPPTVPIVDQPIEGGRVGSSVTINGRAVPGGTVHLTLAYTGKVLVLGSQGKLFDADVVADGEGKWTSGAIALNLPAGVADANLTLTAVAVGPDGVRSDSATVHFKK